MATIAYFITLVVVRAFVTATHGETRDYLLVGGVHIHHLVLGIIAILVAGVFALDEVLRLTRAVLFGIGAALVLDEFALARVPQGRLLAARGDPQRVRARHRPARPRRQRLARPPVHQGRDREPAPTVLIAAPS